MPIYEWTRNVTEGGSQVYDSTLIEIIFKSFRKKIKM